MGKASSGMRVWFLLMAVILWLGIWLTGFGETHWLLYIPAIAFVFAGVSGICPSQMLVFGMFKKDEAASGPEQP